MNNLMRRRFPREATEHYIYSSAEELLENTQDIEKMITHHMSYQRPRLDELDDYYKGNNKTILEAENRRREDHLSDHRATHNFAKYVSQFITGYLAGNPITMTHENEMVEEKLSMINRVNDVDALNSDLILDLSIYGRAYELLYRNEKDENRVALSSPLHTFVIYDDTVEQKPIAAIRYYQGMGIIDQSMKITVYTEDRIYTYTSPSSSYVSLEQEPEEQPNYFQGIPINEYTNNRFRQGDYEDVLNLIDLYDASQSDIANYMTDLNDAMLKIIGNVDLSPEEAEKMRESNILFLKTEPSMDGRESKAEADYIYKKYDVSGVESYKDRLQADIHKTTNTPDMNDTQFAGQQTGESMKYKLFGLEQVRAIKERLFKRSLMNRYRLMGNIMSAASELKDSNMEELSIQFTPNLPRSLKDEIEMFVDLGGELPMKMILQLLSIVDNPEEVMDMLKEEKQERMDDYPEQNFPEGANKNIPPVPAGSDPE